MNTDQSFLELKDKLYSDYESSMKRYNQQLEQLKSDKEKFRQENPGFPHIDILFLNVLAPPKKIEIKFLR